MGTIPGACFSVNRSIDSISSPRREKTPAAPGFWRHPARAAKQPGAFHPLGENIQASPTGILPSARSSRATVAIPKPTGIDY
jgi:hypothetical protein